MVDFDVESWIWFSVVMFVALSRYVSRRLVLGSFKAFQADDYVMVVALAFYVTLIVTINIVAVTNSNLLPPGYDTAHMTQQDIDERTYGSKLILVVEECQCTVVWTAKACLLIMYMRFTVLAKENLLIKILAGYVAFGYVLMEILYLGVWCRPFYEYWAVPTDNIQCDAATNHLITNAVLNLSSDLAMLIIGLPIFIRIHVPLRQKIPIILLFSLGVFVIVAAVLNKVYSFSEPFGTDWVFWYVRESSTALIVANMPFVWSLYRRLLFNSAKELEHTEVLDMISSTRSPRQLVNRSGAAKSSNMMHSQRSFSNATADDRSRAGTTAQEMLKAEYLAEPGVADTQTADVNPYTHPALYYALVAKRKQEQPGADRDLEEGHSEHGDTGLDAFEHEPATSIGRSAASSSKPRSLGSFV